MGSNKYIITKIKCWPVFKQDPIYVHHCTCDLCSFLDVASSDHDHREVVSEGVVSVGETVVGHHGAQRVHASNSTLYPRT